MTFRETGSADCAKHCWRGSGKLPGKPGASLPPRCNTGFVRRGKRYRP
jgi:hypothetical protein